ncbi:MAG: ABC transporter permease [Bdellovibrionales bacterium]
MRAIGTIAWKDFKSYFSGSKFYFIAMLFCGFLSFGYRILLEQFAKSSVQYMMQTQGQGGGLNLHSQVIVGHISYVHLVLFFFVPFLTVRLFAEEKKMRSFDLLMTSPVTSTQIVVGKFLAGLGVALVLILISLYYPLVSATFADVQWGPLASAYLGLTLLVAAYVAVGVFCSSLTDSVIVAGITSIIFSLMLWFVAWGSAMAETPLAQTVLNHMAVTYHFSNLVKGNVELSGIIFHLSVITLYCFLTQRVVESHRWR